MRRLALLGFVAFLGCGSSGGGGGAVDPGALDACLAWANGVCRLAYLCVDPANQDAAFHARYGSSDQTCFDALMKRCQSNQTGSGAFGPSCGPGKVVNQSAVTTCQGTLDSLACTDWTAMPSGGCEGICGASSTPDAGSGADAGGTRMRWGLGCGRRRLRGHRRRLLPHRGPPDLRSFVRVRSGSNGAPGGL